MARLIVNPNVDTEVAARFVYPVIRRAAGNVEEGAKRAAPSAKTWLSARDERVRNSHRHADGQTIPDNLLYQVPKVNTGDDVNDIRTGYDLARAPRDPNLPIGNRINCRCVSVELPRAVAESIHAGPTELFGTRVTAEISTEFTRAAESEFGATDERAAHFMRAGLNEAAARMREATARGT